jgi:vacuolar-type H+-ATPase subunit E/Vma4
MTWFQPDGESGRRTASGLPVFTVARRGYDRQQVDAYVTEFAGRLEEVTGRLDQTERAKAQMEREFAARRDQPPSYKELGAKAAMVLEQAGREAATVMEKAGRSAEQLVENAKGRAETIVNEAQTRAADIIRAAERQAGQFDAAARQNLVEVKADTEQVREFRTGLLLFLGRVRGDIDSLLEEAAKKDDRVPSVSDDAPGSEVSAASNLLAEGASEASTGAGPG